MYNHCLTHFVPKSFHRGLPESISSALKAKDITGHKHLSALGADKHVFGLWEEARKKATRHSDDMKPPQRKAIGPIRIRPKVLL